ncbi:TIGR02281 family clan AA aspartic protease [Pelagibacterium sp. H642]|uniref:retropepsin-like aspartic protease family protein n=1 Tax=Pelagibacterium sp. H642 TaxID=1881069 RepID=UPI00281520A2|nr:TIGR02281 family clan AA aspartic protease [Pelagibacterium sp. H642]WMT91114.1 TIGR02281 family clan AA aspartic protease [Pelagibacterium sp. H642]
MLFVAFAILITVGLAIAISADAGAVFGLTQAQTASAIPLVVIGTLLASALVGRRHRLGEILSGFLVWLAIGAVLILVYTYRGDLQRMGQRIVGALQPGVAIVDRQSGNVHISRSFGGSFRVDSVVNGVPVPMIFDTGASAVVLSLRDAQAAGIDTASLNYSVPVQTANGEGRAAPIRLKTIEVGNILRHNIRAFVVEDNALDTSLLGMTFLETLSRYSVSQDSLELHN